MPTCAFLTMDDLQDFVSDDALTHEPLRALGWRVESVSWRAQSVDWSAFDAVVIRTPWDYQNTPHEFVATLERIATKTLLLNPLDVVRWNIEKTYLRELEKRGVRAVPTLWRDSWNDSKKGSVDAVSAIDDAIDEWFEEFSTHELIVKPVVSANADNTFRIGYEDHSERTPTLARVFASRPFMVQPFMEQIVREGEFSVFFFGGAYSHTILKTPTTNDFRVQEEHGGFIQGVEPSAELLAQSQAVMRCIETIFGGKPLLYARIDLVRVMNAATSHEPSEVFAVMECELIEPSLYFRTNAESPKRFAEAIHRFATRAH